MAASTDSDHKSEHDIDVKIERQQFNNELPDKFLYFVYCTRT